MTRLQAMRTQKSSTVLFLDEFAARPFTEFGKKKVFKTFPRRDFENVVPGSGRGLHLKKTGTLTVAVV